MSYDLILYFNCGCIGKVHNFECAMQQRLRLTAETPPGFMCVRLGSFAIPDLEEIRDKALNAWRMYEFDIVVEPPLKKFERSGRKTYVALVSMEQEYMARLNDLIVEMEQWFGPILDYQPYLIDICDRDPEKPKKHPELLLFEEFSMKVTELRLIEYDSGPGEEEPFLLDEQETFRTIWRLRLLNDQNDPIILRHKRELKMKRKKSKHTRCMVFAALFVLLLGLAGIVAFLIWYNQDDLFGISSSSSNSTSRSTNVTSPVQRVTALTRP